MASLLVNPPDIGLTEHPSSLPSTADPMRHLRPDQLPQTTNEEKLPCLSLSPLVLQVTTIAMRTPLRRLAFFQRALPDDRNR
jgi:hypothetical protein